MGVSSPRVHYSGAKRLCLEAGAPKGRECSRERIGNCSRAAAYHHEPMRSPRERPGASAGGGHPGLPAGHRTTKEGSIVTRGPQSDRSGIRLSRLHRSRGRLLEERLLEPMILQLDPFWMRSPDEMFPTLQPTVIHVSGCQAVHRPWLPGHVPERGRWRCGSHAASVARTGLAG